MRLDVLVPFFFLDPITYVIFSCRSESLLGANLEESLKKAKKSITTSFNHLLKKREGDSAEREIPKAIDVSCYLFLDLYNQRCLFSIPKEKIG